MTYLVRSGHTVSSKVKGDLPDVIYQYIGDDSVMNYHYTLVSERDRAYIFDDFEFEQAKEIAILLKMKVVAIEE